MKIATLFAFFITIISVKAQDWALFPYQQHSHVIKNYDWIDLVYTVSPDSLRSIADSRVIYFQYSDSTHPQYGCADAITDYFDLGAYSPFFPYIDSIVYESGTSNIFGYQIDFNMPFKNNANLLDTFHMLGPGNEAIYVQCYYKGVGDVLGISDSIKKFRFYREGGTTVLQPYTLLLSKNYGLISFFDFNYLADFEEGSTPIFYEISGMQSPTIEAGLKFKEWKDYFPFGENDIQIWEENHHFDFPPYYYNYSNYLKDSITARQDFADSIIITYDRTKKDTAEVLSQTINNSITYYREDFNPLVVGPPGRLVASNYIGLYTSYEPLIYTYNETSVLFEATDTIIEHYWSGGEYYLDTLNCLINTTYDVGYVIGINNLHGIVFKSYGVGDGGSSHTLIGGFIEGVPFGLTDFESLYIYEYQAELLSIYPNPTTDFIKLITNKNAQAYYFIFSIEGQLVQQGNLSNNLINVQQLTDGIYILNVDNLRCKFIKN